MTQHFGVRGIGGNESEREVFLQRESNSALAFRKGYVLIKRQSLSHHTDVFLITDKLSLYYFVGFWGWCVTPEFIDSVDFFYGVY